VLKAVHQVLESYEIEDLNYFEALHATERKYSANWKQYRESKHMWTPEDDTRSRKYPVPNGVARGVLDSDPEVQRLLVSRDTRLPAFRNKMETILTQFPPSCEDDLGVVLHEFILYSVSQLKHDPYPWKVRVYDTPYVFPGKDTYAFWLCLNNMLPHY
jgi:hypothetical protein